VLGNPQVQLAIAGTARLQGAIQPSLVSSTYGVTVPAMKVRIWGRATFPMRIATRISWTDVTDTISSQLGSAKATDIRDSITEGVY